MGIKVETGKDGKKTYTAYWGGIDARGRRIQRKRRGLTTKRSAEKAEFELKRQVSNLREKNPSYTWDEWFDTCIERMRVELKSSTVLEYEGKNRIWMEPIVGGKLIEDITPQDIHDIVFNPVFEVTWYTRRATLKKVHRIFHLAVEEGLIRANPARRIKVKVPEARKAVLNRNEVDRLLMQAKIAEHRFYDIWVMAVLTGMRSGELYALKWDDVSFDEELIFVQRNWTSKNGYGPTKNSRYRVVPISSELKSFLGELRLRAEDPAGFVLNRPTEWTRGNQAQVLKDFCEAVGVTPIRFHDLRATFITQMLGKGVPVAKVMAIVGHSDIKTTQGYLRLAGLDVKGSTEVLEISLPKLDQAKVMSMNDFRS